CCCLRSRSATQQHQRQQSRMDPVKNPLEINELHHAVLAGSIERTLAVLATGSVDIDQGDAGGVTPLIMAAIRGHSHVMQTLLKMGANVSLVADNGTTALHCCCRAGHATAAELLAGAGADLEAIAPADGATALHLAADSGHPQVVRALITAGANPDSRLPDGVTPLFVAAQGGHLDAMRELLRGKANPSLHQVHPDGYTSAPLDVAARNGHSDVVRELVEEFGVDDCDAIHAGVSALALAASNQHLDIMAILTGAGVVDTGLALFVSAGFGLEASVKFLLRQRHKESNNSSVEVASINAQDSSGYTPLLVCIMACLSQAPRIVRLLIDAGADTTSPVRSMSSKGELEFNGTPLAATTSCLRNKRIADGKPATKERLHRFEAIRRLLLRVEAVHAVSWLWPSDAPFIGRATETDQKPPLPPLRAELPILKRRTKGSGGFASMLLRW
ncbi:unnamed protein product, partial [Ectocarpus fasciculatus]